MQVGLPLDRAHPEPSSRHAFAPSGPRPAFCMARLSKSIGGSMDDVGL